MRLSYPAEMAQWPRPRENLVGFTTTVMGAQSESGTLAVASAQPAQSQGEVNRQRLAEALAAAADTETVDVQWLRQVHERSLYICNTKTISDIPIADAMWTDQVGIALAIQSADCVPVLLAHESSALIAAAHGGWRGLLGGVLEQLVGVLPAAAEQLQAWIGPCISVSHFEVGEDVWGPVISQCPDAVFRTLQIQTSAWLILSPSLAGNCGVAVLTRLRQHKSVPTPIPCSIRTDKPL
ncbi:MAG: laccase domain protein [Pseudomonadota bacterium]|nr:MAG: laccase domain protein [Pseudomonadota bacterium]